MINVIGYGSLLSISSAKETVKNLSNFRLAKIQGYRRIFNKVGIVFFERYNLSQDNKYISSCATRHDGHTEMIVSLFECNENEFLKLYEREHRLKWIIVQGIDEHGKPFEGRMCTEYNDIDYQINKCVTAKEYDNRVSKFYTGKIWRNDILPNDIYLNHCLTAAQQQSSEVYNNFIKTSYLADNTTTISDYISENPHILSSSHEAYSHKC